MSVQINSASPIIEIKTLAAISWLRLPALPDDHEVPKLHLIAACDRILQSNSEILRKATQKIAKMRDEKLAIAILSNYQAVLDLTTAVGGDVTVLDAAEPERIMEIFAREAEARGRELERKNSDRKEANAIAEKQKLLEQMVRMEEEKKLQKDHIDEVAQSLRKAERAAEEAAQREHQRILRIYDDITKASDKLAGNIVKIMWRIAIFGPLFVSLLVYLLESTNQSKLIVYLFLAVISIMSFISNIFGARIFNKSTVDVAARAQKHLENYIVSRKIEQIHLVEDREAVLSLARADDRV